MNLAAFLVIVFAAIFYTTCVDATICKPLSTFKIDCDECQCSEDGTEYSCTVRDCGLRKFLKSDDDAYYLSGKAPNNDKLSMPYLNDEIPPPIIPPHRPGVIQNEFSDDLDYGEVQPNKDNIGEEEEEGLQDVGLEELDASVFDTGLPDDYRLRRFIRPMGFRHGGG